MWQWGKREGNRMLIIDEKAIRKIHAPDGKKLDVRPLLTLINEILKPSATTTVEAKKRKIGSPTQMGQGQGQVDGDNLANSLVKRFKELKKDFIRPGSQPKDFKNMPEQELTELVAQISIQLWYKCSGGGWDPSKTTMELFDMLSRYSWEGKIVLTLAAFALIYKDSSPAAKNTDPVLYLIHAMVELADTIGNINDSRPENIYTLVQTAVSWTVGSIVACTYHIRYIEDELTKLTEKVTAMNDCLGQLLDGWRQKGQHAGDYQRTSTQRYYQNMAELNASEHKRKLRPKL